MPTWPDHIILWGSVVTAAAALIGILALTVKLLRTSVTVANILEGEAERRDKSGAVIQDARPGVLARIVGIEKSQLQTERTLEHLPTLPARVAAIEETVTRHTTQIDALTDALIRNHPHDPAADRSTP